jgi:hypothetical protein
MECIAGRKARRYIAIGVGLLDSKGCLGAPHRPGKELGRKRQSRNPVPMLLKHSGLPSGMHKV